MGRTGATIVVIVVTVLVLVVVLGLFLVVIVEQGARLVHDWPIYQAQLQSGYQAADLPPQVRSAIDARAGHAARQPPGVDEGTAILGFVQGVLGLVGTVFAFFILPFFTFYLVKDQPRMAASFDASIPGPWREDVRTTLDYLKRDFATYFKAELTVGDDHGRRGHDRHGRHRAGLRRRSAGHVRGAAGADRPGHGAAAPDRPHHQLHPGGAARGRDIAARGRARQHLLLHRVQHRGIESWCRTSRARCSTSVAPR